MLNRLFICFLYFFILSYANSQDVQSLRAPSTPAFSVLNFEPSSILKPSSLKDIGTDVLNSFDENGKLRMNLGIELTPYWLSSRPYLTFEKYTKPTLGQTILQTFNLSFATVKDSVTNKDKFGVGLRFQLKNGKPDAEYLNKEKLLQKRIAMQSIASQGRERVIRGKIKTTEDATTFFMNFLKDSNKEITQQEKDDLLTIFEETIKNYTDTTLKEFFEELHKKLIDTNSPLASKVVELSKSRYGLFLEFAGAMGFAPSKEKQGIERSGVWLTASYYYKTGDSWFASARYQFSNKDTSQNNFDFGLSYAKELKSVSISTEGMFRWYSATLPGFNNNNQPVSRIEKDITWRFALQGSVLITEGISLNLSLGKDFNAPFNKNQGYFSIVGFNYTFIKKVVSRISKSKN